MACNHFWGMYVGRTLCSLRTSRDEDRFKERKELVEDFRRGKISVLVNVDIFSEGFDCPDVEFVQLASHAFVGEIPATGGPGAAEVG